MSSRPQTPAPFIYCVCLSSVLSLFCGTTETERQRQRMNILTMKVFVHFENYRETFDIPSDLTVRGMKQKVKVL